VGLLDRPADRIFTIRFGRMMGEEKRYDFPCLDLFRCGVEPKAALRSSSGVNKTAPTKELKHLCRLGLRYPDALTNHLRLQRDPFVRKAGKTFERRVHGVGKSRPDHCRFILSDLIVLKGEVRQQ